MSQKLEDNKPYIFKEYFRPKFTCHCRGEVVIRLVLIRHVKNEHYFDSNPAVGGVGRGGTTQIISPTLEFTTYCEICALRYDLEQIEEIRGNKIIDELRKKYAKKYDLKVKD